MNDIAPEQSTGTVPHSPMPEREEGRLRRFFLMRDALRVANASALREGQPGFAEYTAARSLLQAAEQFDAVAERLFSTIVLLQQAAVIAARGLVLRKSLAPAADPNAMHFATIWHVVLERPEVATTWATLTVADQNRVDQLLHGGTEGLTDAKLDLATLKNPLERIARLLYELLEDETLPPVRIRNRRAMRWLGVGVALSSLLALGVWLGLELMPEPPGPANRALHKNVSISSNWRAELYPPTGIVDGEINQLGCHTQGEQNPWVQIDLGRRRLVSRVVVTNRLDGLSERAIPLSVQLSTNGEEFKEVARQASDFKSWTAVFSAQKARYVRLTVLNASILHLNEVEVY